MSVTQIILVLYFVEVFEHVGPEFESSFSFDAVVLCFDDVLNIMDVDCYYSGKTVALGLKERSSTAPWQSRDGIKHMVDIRHRRTLEQTEVRLVFNSRVADQLQSL